MFEKRRYRLRSGKYIREKRERLLRKSSTYAVVLILFVVLLILVSRLEQFAINEVQVEGNYVINAESVKKIAQAELEGKYFGLFPRSNVIIFPSKSIGASVASIFKRIENIDVSFDGWHSIKVSIEERKPSGVWCGGSFEEGNGESKDCFFLDEDGYIFSESPHFSGNLFFRYYGGNENISGISSRYLDEDTFKERAFFIQSLHGIGLNPIAYEWGANGDSKIFVIPNRESSIDTTILFNNSDDLSRIFENLILVLEDDIFEKNGVTTLEYIDLRFGNKVYFK